MIPNGSLHLILLTKPNILKHVSKVRRVHNRTRIGNRDWVGFGLGGDATYQDRHGYPFPAIRFKENSNELIALREKEKGDWRKLTLEEKKILYRASFCQTFSEMDAPTGLWKYTLGGTLLTVACAIFLFISIKLFAGPPMPESMSEENRAIQLRQMLDLKMGAASGISSKWDYEKDDWK